MEREKNNFSNIVKNSPIYDAACSYEVSVIVVTYNSNYNRIIKTLDSILKQIDCNFEIIIADDGSEEFLIEEIRRYFHNNGFSEYKIIQNTHNQGTVRNYLSGLVQAEGYYTKGISPGDLLINKKTLRNWLDFVVNNDCEWSFSDAVYYSSKEKELIRAIAHPQDITPYVEKDNLQSRWNYLAFNDIALGASILGKTKLQTDYCCRIKDKVIYAEDNMWRLMVFDGIVGEYYPQDTIMYEYGSGISTINNEKWNKRLRKDWDATDSIMKSYKDTDRFQKEILRYCFENKTIIEKLLDIDKIKYLIKRKVKKRYTNANYTLNNGE